MKTVTSYLIYGILVFFLLPGSSMAGVITADLEELLAAAGPEEEVAVIITLKDKVDLKKFKDKDKAQRRTKIVKALKDKAEKTQKPVKNFLQQNKAKKIKSFFIFNGLAATLKAELVETLAEMDEVESVSLDATMSLEEPVTDSAALPEWNISAINAPELWILGYTGEGTVLANMDTGVDASHPDLAPSFRGGANSWYDPNGEHPTPHDSNGHGTQTMGIMVGGYDGGSSIGVAPGAQWIAVKIFDDADTATNSAIHAGFEWLLDPDGNPDTDDAPDVVNNSWGFSELVNQCYTAFQPDVQALKAAQIGVVFSAGNSGPLDSTSESPANYPESYAAGSVGQTLVVSNSSARGPSACAGAAYPELVAPGESIYTADSGNSYASVAGTSFAAPHVAGAMGLLLSTDHTRSIGDIESALSESARDLGTLGPDNDNGHGLLDVVGAYIWLSENQSPCTDDDGDGFCAEPDLHTAQDCDDAVASIYPGATEIKHDGADQDCNGYDLTIDIVVASYIVSDRELTVEASSSMGKAAELELAGYGAMKWNRKRARWAISIGSVLQDPQTVTVLGPEGQESALTVVDSGGSSGGGKGGGKGKGKKK